MVVGGAGAESSKVNGISRIFSLSSRIFWGDDVSGTDHELSSNRFSLYLICCQYIYTYIPIYIHTHIHIYI